MLSSICFRYLIARVWMFKKNNYINCQQINLGGRLWVRVRFATQIMILSIVSLFFSLMKENFFNESNHYYSALQCSFASNWFLTILPSNLSFLGSFIQRWLASAFFTCLFIFFAFIRLFFLFIEGQDRMWIWRRKRKGPCNFLRTEIVAVSF